MNTSMQCSHLIPSLYIMTNISWSLVLCLCHILNGNSSIHTSVEDLQSGKHKKIKPMSINYNVMPGFLCKTLFKKAFWRCFSPWRICNTGRNPFCQEKVGPQRDNWASSCSKILMDYYIRHLHCHVSWTDGEWSVAISLEMGSDAITLSVSCY